MSDAVRFVLKARHQAVRRWWQLRPTRCSCGGRLVKGECPVLTAALAPWPSHWRSLT